MAQFSIIDLTGVEVRIRELSNEVFDSFRLSFGSSSTKKTFHSHLIPHEISRQQCFRQSVSKV